MSLKLQAHRRRQHLRLCLESLERRLNLSVAITTFSDEGSFFGAVEPFRPLNVPFSGLTENPVGVGEDLFNVASEDIRFFVGPGPEVPAIGVSNEIYDELPSNLVVGGISRSDLDFAFDSDVTKFGFTVVSNVHEKSVASLFSVQLLSGDVALGEPVTFVAEPGEHDFFGLQSSVGFNRLELREVVGGPQNEMPWGGIADRESFGQFYTPTIEVIRGAVSEHAANDWMGIQFRPNLGFTIAEAAAICGVHAFNYEQRIVSVRAGLDLWQVDGRAILIGQDSTFLVRGPGNQIISVHKKAGSLPYELSGQNTIVDIRNIDLLASGQPNSSNDVSAPVFTRLTDASGAVQGGGALDPALQIGNASRSYIMSRFEDGSLVLFNQGFADDKVPVFEFGTTNPLDITKQLHNSFQSPAPLQGPILQEFDLRMVDRPGISQGFAKPGDFIAFKTTLVGVDEENNVTMNFQEGFSWKTNTVIVSVAGELLFDPTEPFRIAVSGGVFDVIDLESPTSPTLIGDLNGDNQVNIEDLAILQVHFGIPSGASWSMGDFNGDGAVTRTDAVLLSQNFGRLFGPLAPAATPTMAAAIVTSRSLASENSSTPRLVATVRPNLFAIPRRAGLLQATQRRPSAVDLVLANEESLAPKRSAVVRQSIRPSRR